MSTPTTMLSLPNNHVLMGCEVGDGCIVRLPTPAPRGSSRGPHATRQSVSSTLHNAAPVWAFTVANLQQLPQDQVGCLSLQTQHLACPVCKLSIWHALHTTQSTSHAHNYAGLCQTEGMHGRVIRQTFRAPCPVLASWFRMQIATPKQNNVPKPGLANSSCFADL